MPLNFKAVSKPVTPNSEWCSTPIPLSKTVHKIEGDMELDSIIEGAEPDESQLFEKDLFTNSQSGITHQSNSMETSQQTLKKAMEELRQTDVSLTTQDNTNISSFFSPNKEIHKNNPFELALSDFTGVITITPN